MAEENSLNTPSLSKHEEKKEEKLDREVRLSDEENRALNAWYREFKMIGEERERCSALCGQGPFKAAIKDRQDALSDLLYEQSANTLTVIEKEKVAKSKAYLAKKVREIAQDKDAIYPWRLRHVAYHMLMDRLNTDKAALYRAELAEKINKVASKKQRTWALGSTVFSGLMVLINGVVSAFTTGRQPLVVSGLSTTCAVTCFGGVMTYYAITHPSNATATQTSPIRAEALDPQATLALHIQGNDNHHNENKSTVMKDNTVHVESSGNGNKINNTFAQDIKGGIHISQP